jgi:hypothetical protein
MGSLDGSERQEVAPGLVTSYRLVGEDLLIVRGLALVAQHLDTRKLALTGEPTVVLAGGASAFAGSPSVLAYQSRRDGGVHELTWFDRTGRTAGTMGDRADYSNLELSPDGTRVATAVLDPRTRTRDIWISAAGGSHPRWRGDRKELFYVSLDNKLMAAEIEGVPEELRIGTVQPLFAIHPPSQFGYSYDVMADGQRFLVNTDVGTVPPLTVVTNWKSGK